MEDGRESVNDSLTLFLIDWRRDWLAGEGSVILDNASALDAVLGDNTKRCSGWHHHGEAVHKWEGFKADGKGDDDLRPVILCDDDAFVGFHGVSCGVGVSTGRAG